MTTIIAALWNLILAWGKTPCYLQICLINLIAVIPCILMPLFHLDSANYYSSLWIINFRICVHTVTPLAVYEEILHQLNTHIRYEWSKWIPLCRYYCLWMTMYIHRSNILPFICYAWENCSRYWTVLHSGAELYTYLGHLLQEYGSLPG